MAYSELANWDGSLSSTNSTSPPKTSPGRQAQASGSTSRVQATNYAPGIAKEYHAISYNVPTWGEPGRRGEVDAAGLRTAATRPTTVNAVAYGFGNDQTLLDSGCVPLKRDIGFNKEKVDKSNLGLQQATDGNTVAKVYPKPGGGSDTLVSMPEPPKQSDPMINETIRTAEGPVTTSESPLESSAAIPTKFTELPAAKKERSNGSTASSHSTKYPELYQILRELSTSLPSVSLPVPNSCEINSTTCKEAPITPGSSILGDMRHSDPPASIPPSSTINTQPKRDTRVISRKGLKFDGVYLPPIELNRDLYQPLSSYFPLGHSPPPVPRAPDTGLNTTSQAARSNVPNDNTDRPTTSTHMEVMFDKDIIVAARSTKVITGLTASSPIVVDPSSDSSKKGEYLPDKKIVVSGSKFASTSKNPNSPSSSVPAAQLPQTRREDGPGSTIVVNNSKTATPESRHKNVEETDTIYVSSLWKKPTLPSGSTASGISSTSGGAAPGKGKSRAQDDFDFEDNMEETCHQCRQKNIYAKMKCCRIKDDKLCNASFCHRCIFVRYPELEFVADAVNFVCPRCLGTCNCDKCCAAQGKEYVPASRSRKLIRGIPLLLSHTETMRRGGVEGEEQLLKDAKKGPLGKKRGPRTSRTKAKIGEEAESWIRAQEKDAKSSGRTLRRTFIGEWSKAWGAQPPRIREMDCAALDTDTRTQSTSVEPDDTCRRNLLYIGEPVHQLLHRFKEEKKAHADTPIPNIITVSQTVGPMAETRINEAIQVDKGLPRSKRQKLKHDHSTPGIPEFTYNYRDSEAASSSTSSLTRLVTPSESVFDYNACLLPSLRHDPQNGYGYDAPMLGSVNQPDGLDGLDLDLNTSSLDHMNSDRFPSMDFNRLDGQSMFGAFRKPLQEQIHTFDSGADAMALFGETLNDSNYAVPLSGDAVIFGMPSSTGLTTEDYERVARMALASISNPIL